MRVYCRLRPPLTAERARGDALCVTMDMDNVRVDEPKRPPIVYELDACFAPERPQEVRATPERVNPHATTFLVQAIWRLSKVSRICRQRQYFLNLIHTSRLQTQPEFIGFQLRL